MRSFLEVGGQTREAEKRMGQLVTEVDCHNRYLIQAKVTNEKRALLAQ